jgi:uncharacterized protein involved in exopolysaccharide biosynthesis
MDFLSLWIIFRTHYRWIVAITLIVMVGTYLYVRQLPKIYASTAKIVIPQRATSPGAAFIPSSGRSGGDGIAGLVAGSLGIQATGTLDLFTAYLDSRTMAEDVVAHFDIQRRFKIAEPQQAAIVVMGMREFIPKKTGTIDIRVEATDPNFAADMANFYADNLDRMNRTFSITDANRQRRFIEARLVETHKALREAEERVRQFEDRNKTLAGANPEDGPRRSMDTFSRLQNTLLEEEIRLASMRLYATDENPEVVLQKLRIEKIQRQLEDAQYGNNGNSRGRRARGGTRDRSFSLPVAELPSTLLEGIRLRRDLKLQEAMFSLLSSQLEQAKISEARDLPTLQILDRAVPPLYPVKPQVRRSVLFVGLLSFGLACLGAYGWELLRRRHAQLVSGEQAPARISDATPAST